MITTLSLSPAVDKIYFADNFMPGGLYRVRDVVKSAGGKGINVARVASLLGEGVRTLGFKAGETGRWLEAQLKILGIETAFIEVEGESRTNNNIIDRATGTETEVLEIGPYISPDAVSEFLVKFYCSLANTEVLVCSGGLPEGIADGFYRQLIEIAVSRKIRVILDTSGEMLKEGIQAVPYMIKPNLRELCEYAGQELREETDILAVCRNILSQGVKAVLTSLGKGGAILVTEERVIKAQALDVPVINTIGSGDSMVAGCAAAIARGYKDEEMLRLGMACAVANTQFAEIGMVRPELVQKFMQEIWIE